jgi:integrase
MVFKARGTNVYKLRVVHHDDPSIDPILSTGTTSKDIADDVERMVDGFRAQRKWTWINLIAEKKVKLPLAYDAFVDGQIEAFFAAAIEEDSDVDLDPLIADWGERANARYLIQVRELIPAGTRFPVSLFTRAELKARLLKLGVGPSTVRKYRSALSALAKSLIEDGVIDTNPTRDIAMPDMKKSDKALKCLNPVQSKKLVLSLDGEQRVIEATMFGSGAEWQAIERLQKSDVDTKLRLIWAHGTKTERFGSFRDRWIEVTEDWCWEILKAWVKNMTPDALVFSTLEKTALERHQRAAKVFGFPHTTLHQYRHTFAKMWIARGATGDMRPDGRNTQWLKNQLGHAPESTLLLDTYGVDIKAAKLTRLTEDRAAATRAEPVAWGLRYASGHVAGSSETERRVGRARTGNERRATSRHPLATVVPLYEHPDPQVAALTEEREAQEIASSAHALAGKMIPLVQRTHQAMHEENQRHESEIAALTKERALLYDILNRVTAVLVPGEKSPHDWRNLPDTAASLSAALEEAKRDTDREPSVALPQGQRRRGHRCDRGLGLGLLARQRREVHRPRRAQGKPLEDLKKARGISIRAIANVEQGKKP